MKKLVYILGMLFIYATITYGQGITMTIGSLTAPVGDTVTIPISVANFNNIGAVSLKIQFNPASLSYVGVKNQPSTGNFTANASAGVLTIGWYDTTPLNIGNGKFLDMQFVFNGVTSNVNFLTAQCEVANPVGNPLVVDYVNGSISGLNVPKLTIPDITAVAGNNISVPINIENFGNVGAISLKITYDPAVLDFIDVSNQPASGNFTSGASGGVITIGWYDSSPLNISGNKLVDLNFKYTGGSSNLDFNTTQCEIANVIGDVLFAEYVNGSVSFNPSAVPMFSLENVVAVPGTDVTVAMNAQRLMGVGAISLKINYDASILTYIGIENAPSSGNFTANAVGGILTIGWYDTTPLHIDSAKFLDIKFSYEGGESNLLFNTALCEVSDSLGNPLNATYNNGKISPDLNAVPSVSIPTVQALAGDNISVPINVNHFLNVGAVSLKITYDPSVIIFTGTANQPLDGNFTVNASGGVISVGWYNTVAYGIDTTVKFVDLQFHYVGGTSSLIFNKAQCEISNTSGIPLYSDFQDGMVEPLPNTVPKLTLDNITAAPGSSVSVPLTVDNFQNIGAISLKIQYDPTVLTFTGITNQPSAGNFTANADNGIITIGWYDTNPFGVDSVKFADIQFDFIGGSSDLTFLVAQCEISNSLGVPQFAEYVNGNVSLAPNSYPQVEAGNIPAKVGETVSVPISLLRLSEAGAVSLKIQYNNAVLTFIGIENQPSDGNFTSNASGGIVTLGWYNSVALGIDSGKFADVKFLYNGGNSNLTFLTAQCEIAKTSGEVIPYVKYVDGSVTANVPPQFTAQMPDTSIDENQTFTFQYLATDANAGSHLFFELITNATGSTLDSLTGLFSWKQLILNQVPTRLKL